MGKMAALSLIVLAIFLSLSSTDAYPSKDNDLERRGMPDLDALAAELADDPETRSLVEELMEEEKIKKREEEEEEEEEEEKEEEEEEREEEEEEEEEEGRGDEGEEEEGKEEEGNQKNQAQELMKRRMYGSKLVRDFYPFCDKHANYTELICGSRIGWWFCRQRCLDFYVWNDGSTQCIDRWSKEECQKGMAAGLCGMMNDVSANCPDTCFFFKEHRMCHMGDFWYLEELALLY